MKYLKIVSVALLFSASALAADGFTFKPAFMYYSNKVDSGTTSGNTYQWIDVGLGYTKDILFFGALYHTPSFTSHGTTDCTYQHSGFGPSFGLRGESAYIIGTYYLDNKRSGCGNGLKNGTHYQVDVGYSFALGSVKIAPQLTYYSWTYTEDDNGALTQKQSYFGLTPMVSLIVDF